MVLAKLCYTFYITDVIIRAHLISVKRQILGCLSEGGLMNFAFAAHLHASVHPLSAKSSFT
jgi:hypothetical protein